VDGTFVLTDRDGSVLVYRQPGGTRTQDKTGAAAAELAYSPVGDDTALEGAKLTLAGSTTAMTLRLTEEDGTVTTWKPVGFTAGTPTVWAPAAVTEPGTVGSTSYSKDGAGRITRILAAAPPGVSCPAAGALVAGCRALNLTYATATTATPTAPGGIAGQLQQVTLEIYNPHRSGGAGMEQVVVASYRYDSTRRLVSVTDPRPLNGAATGPGLTTSYGYDGTSTRLATLTPPGLAALRLSYDTAVTPVRLAQVSRDGANTGDAPAVLTSVLYRVPTSGNGLPDLRADDDPATRIGVEAWDQASPPTAGAAVFGQDSPVHPGAVADLGADWHYADLQYYDALGYTVNTASFGAGGWQRTATDYDSRGNTVRELDAGATAQVAALSARAGGAVSSDEYGTVSVYNSDVTDSTGTVLTPAGSYLTDEFAPARDALLAGGSTARVRPHTHTGYDEGAPAAVCRPRSP